MSNSVSLNSAIAAISEACFALCPVQKREALLTLEQFQTFDGYVEALVAIIDVNSRGSTIMIDCRHLAAVLLKNLIGKRSPQSANVRQNSPVSADCRPLLTPERTALKAFLAEYLHEPECKVALQLSLVTAKIARQDGDMWLKEWPGLIPSLLNAIQGNSFQATGADTYSPASAINQESELAVHTHLRAIRGLSCLSELLSELSNKASGCASSLFAKNYAMLCLQLYPVISKQWAENMKKLLPALSGMCAKADASHTTSAAYKLDGVTSLSASELESLIVHNVLLSKVLRVVLEFGFELICAKVTMFFKTFFKCYLSKYGVSFIFIFICLLLDEILAISLQLISLD